MDLAGGVRQTPSQIAYPKTCTSKEYGLRFRLPNPPVRKSNLNVELAWAICGIAQLELSGCGLTPKGKLLLGEIYLPPPPVSPTLKKILFQWHWQSGASRKLLGIKSNWWCSGSGSAKQCRALEIKGTSSTGTSSWYKQWRASKPPQLVPTLNFDFISTHNGICPPLPCVTC